MAEKRSLVALALVFLTAAAGWATLTPGILLDSLSPGWSWEAIYIGTYTSADSAGRFPYDDAPAVYNRTMKVLPDGAASPSEAIAHTRYFLVDPYTKQTVYEYIVEYRVDRHTGEHLDPRFRGQRWVFPRFAQKTSYTLRADYLEGIPVTYEREDTLNGLPVYLYSYVGHGEYTASYRGSPDFPGVDIPAGQEVRCADDQFRYRVWVEPVTGGIVKVEESCRSGDYLFDAGADRRHAAVARWDAAMAGDHVAKMVERFRWEKLRILALTQGVPAALALLALFSFGLSFRKRAA